VKAAVVAAIRTHAAAASDDSTPEKEDDLERHGVLGARGHARARALALDAVVRPALAALEAGTSVEAALDAGLAKVDASEPAATCVNAANASSK